jgi:hypothetical protein
MCAGRLNWKTSKRKAPPVFSCLAKIAEGDVMVEQHGYGHHDATMPLDRSKNFREGLKPAALVTTQEVASAGVG